jgi:hypothetical protein
MTDMMKLEVCVVDATTLTSSNPTTNKPYTCTTITRPMINDKYLVTIAGPLNNVRLAFIGTDWNGGNGGWLVVDDIDYQATLCKSGGGADATTPTPTDSDANACKALAIHFDLSQADANAIWATISGGAITNVQIVPYTVQPKFDLSPTTQIACPDSGNCAGVLLDKTTTQPEASVWESKEFPALTREHYLALKAHRGTYLTMIYICTQTLPVFNNDGSVNLAASPQCKKILPDQLTFTEFKDGVTTGAPLPVGTTKVYIAFSNPQDSGSAQSGFLVDSIRVLRDGSPTSPQMTC